MIMAQNNHMISPAYNPNSNKNIKQSTFFFCARRKFNPVQIEFLNEITLRNQFWDLSDRRYSVENK